MKVQKYTTRLLIRIRDIFDFLWMWPDICLTNSLACISYPFVSIRIHSYPFVSIRIHSYPFVSIRIHSYPFVSIRIHSYEFVWIRVNLYPLVYLRLSQYPILVIPLILLYFCPCLLYPTGYNSTIVNGLFTCNLCPVNFYRNTITGSPFCSPCSANATSAGANGPSVNCTCIAGFTDYTVSNTSIYNPNGSGCLPTRTWVYPKVSRNTKCNTHSLICFTSKRSPCYDTRSYTPCLLFVSPSLLSLH